MRRIVKWGGGAVLQLCKIVPRGPNGPAPSRRIARCDDAPYLRKHESMCKEVLGTECTEFLYLNVVNYFTKTQAHQVFATQTPTKCHAIRPTSPLSLHPGTR